MPFHHRYPEPTVLKALHWLDQQPNNWTEHIKDTNIAVKMYLKSQHRNNKKKSTFTKEIKQFLKTEDKNSKNKESVGAFLTKKQPSAFHSDFEKKQKPLPPADGHFSSLLSTEDKNRTFLEAKAQRAFFLDEKSWESLEKTKKKLNVQNEEEVLRLLIQLGRNSLEKLFASSV